MLKIKFLLELSHTGSLANMDGQKAEFYRLLKERVYGLKESKKCVFAIQQEKYNQAVAALQFDRGVKCEKGNHFKYWVSTHFKLQQIGGRNVLY